MGDTELSLHEDTDAARWAREFCATWPKVNPGQSCPDESWMLGWFANAMETCDIVRGRALRREIEFLRDLVRRFVLLVHDINAYDHPVHKDATQYMKLNDLPLFKAPTE